jgi:tRNA pseudouridine13 synthase
MGELPYAHGGPPLSGVLRARAEDFQVDELLGFAPTGAGEHAFLTVEKRGANTEWVAKRLAAHVGVGPGSVGFAGLKDRHAVARQHFTVHLPGQADPDWLALADPEFSVIAATRHARKLPRGALAGNRFVLVVREIAGDRDAADVYLDRIARLGAPNYFGSQRFGSEGGNLERARAMFGGRRVGREQRGFLLSSARAELFNRVLAERVADRSWNGARAGDVFQFDRGGSVFGPVSDDPSVKARVDQGQIHPTGPLWGHGPLRSADGVAELETAIAAGERELADGLVAAGLRQERRALRMLPEGLAWQWLPDQCLRLEFGLGSGSYATVLAREVITSASVPDN